MSSSLALYSVAQVRAFDAHANAAQGMPGYTLMRRAGEAALRALRTRWPTAQRIVVVTGAGNNGGDGYVLARFAHAAGLAVRVLALVEPGKLRGDARRAADDYLASGGLVQPFDPTQLPTAEVLVDALLGTGLRAPLREDFQAAIAALNASGRPVFALDLPSGLDGDSGAALGIAVRAETTITFVAPKSGLYFGDGPEYAGRVIFDDLEVVLPEGPEFRPVVERLAEADITRALPRRGRAAHKGDFGRVLLIGGGRGMPGAMRLAGEACLRCGAGLVTVATAPENVTAIVAGRPELICLGVVTPDELHIALEAATVVALGPGLGRGPWAKALFEAVLGGGKPLIIDADGLNLLASSDRKPPPGTILTPHPGEAARLLGVSAAQVQDDRLAALYRLVEQTGAVVVLKGAGTLIGAPGRVPALCVQGNPGMAAPGMGDVLTGAIAGILGQCRDPWLAARGGVQAHALAGDELAHAGGGRSLLALEVAAGLAGWVNGPF